MAGDRALGNWLASWGTWRWLSLARFTMWRLAAALGILVVAVATAWDLYWHQTHPMEFRASMAALPPHQAILAGFVVGLIGGRPRPCGSHPAGQSAVGHGR